ncbi:MAG: 3-hydroxyacyl-CoA dehydrogenase NAD-binding domain-containing protein [Solirubrobacterales bacterium]
MNVEQIGVVGAGTMGTGIAMLSSLGGYETLIWDPDEDALDRAAAAIGDALGRGEGKHWTPDEAEAAALRLIDVPMIGDLSECDLIIEAAPESLTLKRTLFASLAMSCGPDTILATNTSSLRVTDIGGDLPEPGRVVGMHFFNPPTVMKLVEVVATEHSSADAVDAVAEVAERMGRTPIRARDTPGFIANRLARPFSLESLRMLEHEVADAPTIDRVCRLGGGFRMGPFELLDLIGLDVNLSVAHSFYEQGGKPERWRPSALQERMVEEGNRGRKTGLGFYRYSENERHREPDPDLGIKPPTLDPGELAKIDPAAPRILPRLIAQIANEAAFALEEDAGSGADMNTAMRLGFNWPLGPHEFAGLIGATRAVELLTELEQRHGEAYRPSPWLIAEAERK